MTKRSFFLIAAFGLMAVLASGTPSQAGSMTVTLDSTLTIPASPGYTAITQLVVTLNSSVSVSGLTLLTPLPASGATIATGTSGGDTDFTITIPANVSTAYIMYLGQAVTSLKFTTAMGPAPTVKSTVFTVTGPSGTKSGSTQVYTNAIPEPASMALLGIGMAGFFAFRRFFNKRNASV